MFQTPLYLLRLEERETPAAFNKVAMNLVPPADPVSPPASPPPPPVVSPPPPTSPPTPA